MNRFDEMKKWLAKEESGQGMVEYGLIIVLIAVMVMGTVGVIGGKLNDKFNEVANKLGTTASTP